MKSIKPHFVFKSQERNGVFLLVLIIVAIQLMLYFWDFGKDNPVPFFENEKQVMAVQKQIDSLKRIASEEKAPTIYPFNPNFITDYKGYTLGMSTVEIDRLLKHRDNDKWMNSAEEFQKVTGVSDSLLGSMKGLFKFPEFLNQKSTVFSKSKNQNSEALPTKDINKATAVDFAEISGVGAVLSKRIVAYRNKLGGFVDNSQLKDVYGLKPEVIEQLSVVFKVENSQEIVKLDINEVSVLQLSEIPYFNYELAREIYNYRLLHEKIGSFEELTKIHGFPSEKIQRIKLYLTIN